MVTSLITLVAAILALAAVPIFPGDKDIEAGRTDGFRSWGKGASLALGVLVVAVGAYVFVNWYTGKERDLLEAANFALLIVLGLSIMGNTGRVLMKINRTEKETEEEVVEAVHVEEEPVKSPKKVRVKKAKTKISKAPKKVKKTMKKTPAKKVTKERVAKKAVSEELIEEVPEPVQTPKRTANACPSCDSPIDHGHDECPVCGEDLRG